MAQKKQKCFPQWSEGLHRIDHRKQSLHHLGGEGYRIPKNHPDQQNSPEESSGEKFINRNT